MKLIFLHGLGQSAASWKEVRNLLTDYPSEALELFPSGVRSYQKAKERVYQHLAQETEPFVLAGCPLKLSGNILFYFQLLIFKLLPKRVFEKQGAAKSLLLGISEELKHLI